MSTYPRNGLPALTRVTRPLDQLNDQEVAMTTDAFDRVYFRGKLMDNKTAAFLQAMEAELGYELTVVQGCYSDGAVAASAGTHDGGGVVDLAAWDHPRKVRIARDLGAFAWYRPDRPGVWGEHIHLGIRDHGRLSPGARGQQVEYDAGGDGLAGTLPDPNPYRPSPLPVFRYPVKETPVPPKPTRVTHARDAIVEAMHDLGQAAALLDKADPHRATIDAGHVKQLRDARRAAQAVLEDLPKR